MNKKMEDVMVLNSKCAYLLLISSVLTPIGGNAMAAAKFVCQIEKAGKIEPIEGVETRKDCRAKNGKWVKEAAHDHGSEDAGHVHKDGEKDEKHEKHEKDEKPSK